MDAELACPRLTSPVISSNIFEYLRISSRIFEGNRTIFEEIRRNSWGIGRICVKASSNIRVNCSHKRSTAGICLSEDNQELRIGTERVCASTVGPKVATPCQAQLHAERVFLHSWTQCRDTMLNTTDVQTYVCAGTVGP